MAASGGSCAPTITNDRGLKLEASRHPVVEQRLVEIAFTPMMRLGEGTDLVVLRAPTPVARAAIYARSA